MQTYKLTAGDATLTIDEQGNLIALTRAGRSWQAEPAPLWRMTVQAPSDASVLGAHRPAMPAGPPEITASETTLSVRWTGMVVEDQPIDVALTATLTAAEDEFLLSFTIVNRSSSWSVRELRAPGLLVPVADDPPALLWPMGAGERYPDAGKVGLRSDPYPTQAFMPWIAVDAGDEGLYLGCHDGSLQTVTLNADTHRVPGALELSVGLLQFCGPGEAVSTAQIVIRPYAGTWHAAATRYREWAESLHQPVEHPDWVREITGWQLVILKQQNGEIHWPYTDLEKLIALGEENGLNVLGLFGWTEGGHDRRYPIYQPDPAMGGEEALRRGIEQAHAAGQRVILYTNGQLRDIFCEWHDEHGQASAALSERGDPFGESWLKYKDAPPRRMTYGCQSSAIWADTLLALAKQIESLGADGLIFDQLGSCQPPLCFSTEHGHERPSLATGPAVAANLARVQREMQAINPEFIVLIEHVADGVNQYVDFTHGCGSGFAAGGRGFPELLRFTWPEIYATQRHATPAMDRETANWACLYGFAHEVEYRYWPDRRYIESGIVPEMADYQRIGSPPNLGLMRSLEPRAASAYLREVIAFEQRHLDLLRDGRFRDTLGFTSDNQAVLAKGYVNGATTGVMLWNPMDEPQLVAVTVADATLRSADAPGEQVVDPASAVAPHSVRLLRFGEEK